MSYNHVLYMCAVFLGQETNKVSQVVKKAKGKMREEDEGEGDVREGKGQPKGNH